MHIRMRTKKLSKVRPNHGILIHGKTIHGIGKIKSELMTGAWISRLGKPTFRIYFLVIFQTNNALSKIITFSYVLSCRIVEVIVYIVLGLVVLSFIGFLVCICCPICVLAKIRHRRRGHVYSRRMSSQPLLTLSRWLQIMVSHCSSI